MPRCIERDYLDPIKKTLQPPITNPNDATIPIKPPKNIIRCSDGYIEEYSTDEEQIEEEKKITENEKEWNKLPYSEVSKEQVSWKQLANIYFWQNTRRMQWLGWGVGEFFADLFGVTNARYQSEIDMAIREKEEKERQEKITEHCYVNEAGILEMVDKEKKQGSDFIQKIPDTIELDHKGIEIPVESTTQAV